MLLPEKLVCVHAFHGYARGQEITNPADIYRLLMEEGREHHFVKAGPMREVLFESEPHSHAVGDK